MEPEMTKQQAGAFLIAIPVISLFFAILVTYFRFKLVPWLISPQRTKQEIHRSIYIGLAFLMLCLLAMSWSAEYCPRGLLMGCKP